MDGTSPPQLAINGPDEVFCIAFGVCSSSEGEPFSGDRLEGAGDMEQPFILDQEDYQLDLNWTLSENLSATLIAAHREIDEETFMDYDGSPQILFHRHRPNSYEQDSLEIRFDYDSFDRLSITGGYFYWNSKSPDWTIESKFPTLLGLAENACGFDTTACAVERASAESDSDSFYFEGDYRLTDKWSLIAGARYIEETKELSKTSVLPVFGVVELPPTSGKRTDDEVIYRVGARWEPTADIMTFATYSTGFRSGGFSIRATTPDVLTSGYDPETLKNYELGIKTTLLESRLRLNATLFRMEYEDMQLEVAIPGGASGTQDAILNAGQATMNGLEVELSAILNDYFSLDFNAGFLDAEYDEFRGRIFSDGNFNDDNSDLPLRRTPDWNYSVALDYFNNLAGGEVRGRMSYSWTDDYSGTITNTPGTRIDSYGLLDMSVSYTRDQWQFGLFGRNLTDEDEYTHVFTVTPNSTGSALFNFAIPRPPRTFGAEVKYTFGNY